MSVSWELAVKEAPPEIAVNNFWLFNPSELFDLFGDNLIDWDTAAGLINIVPKSGNIKPYEPDPATYPLPDKVPAVPLDPEINCYTLVEPKNWDTGLSIESSVRNIDWIPDPESFKFKDPGNKDCLYLALSKFITQKLSVV